MAAKSTGAKEVQEERRVYLTKREKEILARILEGVSSQDVADEMYVSKRTVDWHLANIYDKLCVSNRVQAFRRMKRLGFIPLED